MNPPTEKGLKAAHTLTRAGLGNNGRMRLNSVARRYALQEGTCVERMAWDIIKALHVRAAFEGHIPSAELFMQLMTEEGTPPHKGVSVSVQQNTVTVGMPQEVAEYTARVAHTIQALEAPAPGDDADDISRFLE